MVSALSAIDEFAHWDPIVVTGVGVLASNGTGRADFWDALREGRSGIGPITRFDTAQYECHVGGELNDFDPHDFMRKAEVRRWHSHVHQSVAAAQLAVDDADFLKAGYPPERIATAIGTSAGVYDEEYMRHQKEYESYGWRAISRFATSATSTHSATAHVSARFQARGPATTMGTGCSTSLDVLRWGVEQIRRGDADAALVGATESPLTALAFAGFSALGILSTSDEPESAMRPFDASGDGLVLGEAACVLVLERESRAKSRGAPILGQISGVAFASEGRNPVLIEKDGAALSRAIADAVAGSGLESTDIDAVHGHGVALAMYDRGETNAYKQALGDHAYRVPISATKAMTGQTYAVGGMLNVAGALMTINQGIMPPTLNLHDPMPECDLDYVPLQARRNDVDHVLVTTLSFGGTHAAGIISRAN